MHEPPPNPARKPAKTRKTLSLPSPLVRRIQAEADAAERSFNWLAARRLTEIFLPETVRQSNEESKS